MTLYLQFFVKPGLLGLRETSTDENSSFRAPQLTRVDTRVYDGLVGVFQQHSIHRVHGVGLFEVHTEEHGVKFGDVVHLSGTLGDLGVI